MSVPTIILYREHPDSFSNEFKLLGNHFDFAVYPIIKDIKKPLEKQSIVEQMTLKSFGNWRNRVIFRLSDHSGLNWNVEEVRQDAETKIMQEIEFAQSFCKTKRYFLLRPSPKLKKCMNLARIMIQCQEDICLIETKMTDWHIWNKVRGHTDYSPTVRLVLHMENEVPDHEVLLRWLGEPVYCLIVPIELFFINAEYNGYPELKEEHQKILYRFIKTGMKSVMLKVTTENHPISLNFYHESLYFYMTTDFETMKMSNFRKDSLEIPLQPLYENLDSRTYELFEKDPAKYKIYQDAIENALVDIIPEGSRRSAVLMIVGAGRGPLVRASINAGMKTKRKIKIYIVEKNPNAIGTLAALKDEIWNESDITIFPEDMRTFQPPEKADILISELLGSLGCNELSPECLDGAQQHLKPNGISIPQSYTSYVNPIMSSKLYENNRLRDRRYHQRDKISNFEMDFECTYIVCPNLVYNIAEPQILFTFVHPNNDTIIDNTRYKTLKFVPRLDTILHGFLGYFEAVLYKKHMISILPATHTQGMFSWNNFYFPLTEPQQIKAGQTIESNFWRGISNQKVWYEWSVTKPNITHIHNLSGRSCPIFK